MDSDSEAPFLRTRVAIVILLATLKTVEGQSSNPGGAPPSGLIVSFNSVNSEALGFNFSYETADGTVRQESGEFVDGIWTVSGQVSWFSPDGQRRSFKYKADDRGYRAMTDRSNQPPILEQSLPATFRGLNVGSLSSLVGVG